MPSFRYRPPYRPAGSARHKTFGRTLLMRGRSVFPVQDGPPVVRGERGISPVIGVIILVAITVLLAAVGGALFFGLVDSPQPAPETTLDVQADGTDTVTLEVGAGDTITGQNTEKLVIVVEGANGTARKTWAGEDNGVVDLSDERITAGQHVTIGDATGPDTGDLTVPFDLQAGDTLRVVWHAPDSDRTATLASERVPELADSPGSGSDSDADSDTSSDPGALDQPGAVVTGSDGAVGDGGDPIDIGPSNPQALGASADVDSDGRAELPAVDGSGDLVVSDSDGARQTVVDRSDVPNAEQPDTDKTLMATGNWDGSPQSVFYANENHNDIYRVTPGGSPTLVASLDGNGVNSVLGPGDIDGDGTDELVYAGGSQEIRYVEPGGTTETTGFTSGSSTGIGNGPLVDFDGDGTDSALVVDGSNDVRLVEADGAVRKPAQSSVDAAKSPVTAADVDGDSAMEIVYVDASSSTLRYIDEVGESPAIGTLRHDTGSTVTADKDTGVVS